MARNETDIESIASYYTKHIWNTRKHGDRVSTKLLRRQLLEPKHRTLSHGISISRVKMREHVVFADCIVVTLYVLTLDTSLNQGSSPEIILDINSNDLELYQLEGSRYGRYSTLEMLPIWSMLLRGGCTDVGFVSPAADQISIEAKHVWSRSWAGHDQNSDKLSWLSAGA